MAIAGQVFHYASYLAFTKEVFEVQRLAQGIFIAKIFFGNFFRDDNRVGLFER